MTAINYSTFDNASDPLGLGKVSADIYPNSRYIACVSASHDFLVSLNGGAWATFKSRRDLLSVMEITGLKVKNPHTVDDLVVDFVFTDGQVKLNLQTTTIDNFPAVQSTNIQNWPATPIDGVCTPEVFNTVVDVADVSIVTGAAVILSVSRATKRKTIVKNKTSNVNSFRVGGATVTSLKGITLEPGDSFTFTGSMAVYAYNLGGGTEKLEILEVDNV